MNHHQQLSDDELAAILLHDPEAFYVLVSRHLDGIYDCALRINLNPEAAEESTQVVWQTVRTRLAEKPPTLAFPAWLYGLVRNASLERVQRQAHAEAEDQSLSPLDARFLRSTDPAIDDQVALWTWQAARGQRPRDYSLLDLALRRQLTPEEIGSVASLTRSSVYTVLGRLRGAFEESFAATYLYFRGRNHCDELYYLSQQAEDLGPSLRREIARHSEGCLICRQNLAGLPLAADIFASLRLVQASDGLIEAVLPSRLNSLEPEPPMLSALASDDVSRIHNNLPAPELNPPVETIFFIPTPPIISETAYDPDPETEMHETPVFHPEALEAFSWQEEILDLPEGETWPHPQTAEDELPHFVPPSRPAHPPSLDVHTPAPIVAAFETPAEVAEERIPFRGDRYDGMPPPRGPWTAFMHWYQGQSPQRILLLVAALAAIALAAYAGIAIGDSIRGTGRASGAIAPLPTQQPDIREVACGTTPIMLDQGTRATITFDKSALPGYDITGVDVVAISSAARLTNVSAVAQEGLSVMFEAQSVSGSAGRVDEYRLSVTFQDERDQTTSDCRVLVNGPQATATSAPRSTQTAPTATLTSTPAPSFLEPIPALTSVPPTSLPTALQTSAAPTALPAATADSVAPTSTPRPATPLATTPIAPIAPTP